MKDFTSVKTSELSGQALDWAVAMADRWEPDRPQDGQVKKNGVYLLVGPRPKGPIVSPDWFFAPSTNWAQGGPLRDKFKVDITELDIGILSSICTDSCECVESRGATALIAICRVIVATELGETVMVPSILVK